MTFAAAIAELKLLTFTGLTTSYEQVLVPPSADQLPALIIDAVSQPFIEGLQSWTVGSTKAQLVVFVDHLLLIEYLNAGTHITRSDNITTYLDRYVAAITDDMRLDGELSAPIQLIVVKRGAVRVRNQAYSGIKFRLKMEIVN